MRRRLRAAAIVSALAGAAVAVPAAGCSTVPGYRAPTNLELATAADTIVVAEVIGERPGTPPWDTDVRVRPTTLLKGRALPAAVDLRGAELVPPRVFVTRSAPRELRLPNRDTLSGGCWRHLFVKGMKLVLFLTRDGRGRLVPFRSPFTRDAEDVAGDQALWVKAVREYAAISLLPPDRRRGAMQRRIAELRARPGDADAAAIADDMAIELAGKRNPATD